MKKILVLSIAMLMGFLCEVHAQSGAQQLIKHCAFGKNTEYLLTHAGHVCTPNLQMSEYIKDIDGRNFVAGLQLEYEWSHANIPLENVANDIWRLVSKQLNGEEGTLTLTKLNFFLTKDPKGVMVLATVVWSKLRNKWMIMSVPVYPYKKVFKGNRQFDLKS